MSDSYHIPRSEYRQHEIDDMIAKAVAAEREACARAADDEAAMWDEPGSGWASAKAVANRIRNRT